MSVEALFSDLMQELEHTTTLDTHEHLVTEAEAIAAPRDFYYLFKHYCQADLVAAGASPDDLAFFDDQNEAPERRWQDFSPFFNRIRTGAYARAVMLVIHDILDLPDLNDDTCIEVGRRLQKIAEPGLYHNILHKQCNITTSILCNRYDNKEGYPDNFYHLASSVEVTNIMDKNGVDNLAAKSGISIHSLRDLLECLNKVVCDWCTDDSVVGIKLGHAYFRSLEFKKRTFYEAETIFNKILTNELHTLSAHEAIPLNDFLVYELVARAEAHGMPIAIHTGLQAGNFYRISNTNPLLLQDLLLEFPRARFDLFHGGMPWVREIAVLAKYFPGVYLNMAWMHLISPAQSRSALSEWLDIVPNNKIFGFGGDYTKVEKVYGHLVMARRNIAQVLTDKISAAEMSRQEAGTVIKRLMYDNAAEFYCI